MSTSWVAPHRCSPRAAPLTSVSNPIGTSNAARSGPTTSVSVQPGFGVLVTHPKVGESGFGSQGPKVPYPIAAICSPCSACQVVK